MTRPTFTNTPPGQHYPGMVRAELNGKTVHCVGHGPEVEQAVIDKLMQITGGK